MTAWAILVLIRDVPAEAALDQPQPGALSQSQELSASAALVGFGRRASGPARARRVVGVVDHRTPRRRALVAGDLDRS